MSCRNLVQGGQRRSKCAAIRMHWALSLGMPFAAAHCLMIARVLISPRVAFESGARRSLQQETLHKERRNEMLLRLAGARPTDRQYGQYYLNVPPQAASDREQRACALMSVINLKAAVNTASEQPSWDTAWKA